MCQDEAVFIVTYRGRFESVNDSACALLGYERETLLELHGAELILPEDRSRVSVSLDLMRVGELTERPGKMMRKDGRVVDVQVRARRLPDKRLELRVRAVGGGS